MDSAPNSSGSGKPVDDSEFLEMTQQDPAQVKVLRQSLEHLASGLGGNALKEMAQEVLSGRMGLREAANVAAYAEQAVEQAAPLAEKWASMSDRERDELAAEARGRAACGVREPVGCEVASRRAWLVLVLSGRN